MSHVRRNSLIVFIVILLLGVIFAPGHFFDPRPNNTEPRHPIVQGEESVGDTEVSPQKLIVAPILQSTEQKKDILPVNTPVESTFAAKEMNNAYPESTIFAREDYPKQNVATSDRNQYGEMAFKNNPMLPSKHSVPARHISEKKIIIDSPEPETISGESLMNGRHLPRKFTHVIEDGDSLEMLAQRYLWDANRAKDVYEENRELLPSMTELPIGVTIVLPERR